MLLKEAGGLQKEKANLSRHYFLTYIRVFLCCEKYRDKAQITRHLQGLVMYLYDIFVEEFKIHTFL
jgi:hypothetical protein